MSRITTYRDRLDAMLAEDTEEFLWALANIMNERAHEIEQEAVLPRSLQDAMTTHYRGLGSAAYDFAKMINPNRA